MSMTLADAAAELSEMLHRENAALEAMDLAAAAAMLPEKRRVTETFANLREQAAGGDAGIAAAIAELRDLAEQNRLLLSRGITVQGRLIGLVARAAAEGAQSELEFYGAGGMLRVARMPAMALAARA